MRRAVIVRGAVQGVGFRPAVARLAARERLAGFVHNVTEGVAIEVEGEDERGVARFVEALRREAPPLARVDSIEESAVAPRGDVTFRIVASARAGEPGGIIPADAATCDACLRELFDPRDRRHRHPFINCTDCGPRFSIVRDLPYDRSATTMSAFAMCSACRAEYEDPFDRRFHAEANACPDCGPRVALVENGSRSRTGDDAMIEAARRLREGQIVALKGLGGYQLAVDATCESAVARLRARKRRPDRPFALLARNLEVVEDIARLDRPARDVLSSRVRPIVLLRARPAGLVAPSVAPALDEIGVMLPTTPLHHLLCHDGPPALVMTSGNRAEEPICRDDEEAFSKLADIADVFLVHDRAIHARVDDSVVRIVGGAPQPVRRARGLVPVSISLGAGEDVPSILALGAQQKSTVCVTRGAEAFVSQHIGDLDGMDARSFFGEVVDGLVRMLGVTPVRVAHDLHPDYYTSEWAFRCGLPPLAVQHHHAHVASCVVDAEYDGPVIGVAFDGTGCGPSGDLWGGEFLVADLGGFVRAGHLRELPLPGGEAAIREPWRLAAAALHDACLDVVGRSVDPRRLAVARMLERSVGCPGSTGAGRWFDAIAAMLGVREIVTYDAQAAIELEALANPYAGASPYPITLAGEDPFVIDLRPAVRAIARGTRFREPPGLLAARFHATLADAILQGCRRVRQTHGLRTVALSGGCFQNRLLTEASTVLLLADGFDVLLHRRVPANDGGLALGQAAIAAHRERTRRACA